MNPEPQNRVAKWYKLIIVSLLSITIFTIFCIILFINNKEQITDNNLTMSAVYYGFETGDAINQTEEAKHAQTLDALEMQFNATVTQYHIDLTATGSSSIETKSLINTPTPSGSGF